MLFFLRIGIPYNIIKRSRLLGIDKSFLIDIGSADVIIAGTCSYRRKRAQNDQSMLANSARGAIYELGASGTSFSNARTGIW